MASARRDFEHVLSGRDRRLAPEEAMFRDAARIGQIPTVGTGVGDDLVLSEALSYFDRSAAIRLARASLARVAETSLSHIAAEARQALESEDTLRLRDLSLALKNVTGAESAFAEEISCQLVVAATVITAAARVAAPAMENAS
jgi:hypothetical protein